MPKTNKKRLFKNNKTKKNEKEKNQCIIGLKPFEKEFSQNIPQTSLVKTNASKKKEFVKELMAKFAPHNIKPYDNFYDYINYTWLKNVTLEQQQKYIVQVDDFRLAQDKVYNQLNEIILDYVKNNNNKLSKNLKNYYNSVIQKNSKTYSKQLARQAINIVDNFIKDDNPWALLAYINKDEMLKANAPFVWSLNPDDKEPNIYRCYIYPGQFILLNINVYYDDGTDVAYKKKYRNSFLNIIKKVFDILIGPNNLNPQNVFDVQVDIFNEMGCLDVTSNEKTYNKVSKNEALEKYGFDWVEFSKQLGFKTTPDFFIVSSLNYLKCGSKLLLDNWKTPKWRTFWLYLILKKLVRITKDWEKIIYDFHGKFERGQQELNISNYVSASLYMTIPFNTFLTNEYVKKYENPQAIQFVEILANELKLVFKRILMRNKWLNSKTKKYALLKLENCKFIFSKPDNLREDPDLNYDTILYDNMTKINDWRHKKFIELEGKHIIDIPMVDWNSYPVKMVGDQAYVVNASYTPNKNRIYINLGYIQKPFVDLDERGIEYNLAHIGFTIAHELGHGFDDWGSQYGYDGSLHNWWTAEDKKKYKAIQNDVIKQYTEFAARDGNVFDASIGVGEDLADIQSLSICSEYLRDFQEKNQDIIPIRNLGFQAFYTYFAFQQKQLVGKKSLSAQLKTNPHPLDKYRCNIPLSRSEIFRALYNVKKGDGMWWHNTNTVW
jgi:predicted metalloendopeptidase